MDEKINTDFNNSKLNEVAPTFIGFNIKALETPENIAVHTAFREYCKTETDNNYTLGIRKLLEEHEQDWKYALLAQGLAELQAEMAEAKANKKDNKVEDKKDKGAF